MRKNNIHIFISVFLLALVLVGRVGLHVFHHHEYSAEKNALPGLTISSEEHEAADCALCKLDAFQLLAIEALTIFVFFLTVVKPVFNFLLSALAQFPFFTNSRGPPAFLVVA